MNKFLSVLFISLMTFALAGCGSTEPTADVEEVSPEEVVEPVVTATEETEVEEADKNASEEGAEEGSEDVETSEE